MKCENFCKEKFERQKWNVQMEFTANRIFFSFFQRELQL